MQAVKGQQSRWDSLGHKENRDLGNSVKGRGQCRPQMEQSQATNPEHLNTMEEMHER